MEIPLKNKNKEILGYTIVSEEDYQHLSQYKLYLDINNYVQLYINGKMWRYVLLVLFLIVFNTF